MSLRKRCEGEIKKAKEWQRSCWNKKRLLATQAKQLHLQRELNKELEKAIFSRAVPADRTVLNPVGAPRVVLVASSAQLPSAVQSAADQMPFQNEQQVADFKLNILWRQEAAAQRQQELLFRER